MTGWKSKLNEAQRNDKDKKLLAYLSRQEDRVDPLMAPTTTTTKMLICSGWETAVVPVSQPGTPVRDKRGCPFVPGLATGTEEDLLSRLVTPTGTKGAASAHVARLYGGSSW